MPATIFDGLGLIWSTYVGSIAVKFKTAPFQIKPRPMHGVSIIEISPVVLEHGCASQIGRKCADLIWTT